MKKYTLINIVVIFCMLIMAGSAFYFFVIYPPIHEKELQRLEKERVINIDKLIKAINEERINMWDATCIANDLKKDCDLDAEAARDIEWKTNEQIKRVYIKYPPVR